MSHVLLSSIPPTIGSAVRRRWYVLVAVLLMFVPLAVHAESVRGVYWAKFDVVFLLPPGASNNNALRNGASNIVFYAALIERQFSATHDLVPVKTNGAPLYGTGIRSGTAVYLPDAGGQWQSNFNRPSITVEVVGESEAEATTLAESAAAEIRAMALKPQADLGVDERAYITTTTNPELPTMAYVDVRNQRAVVGIALLALGLGLALAVQVDKAAALLARRQRSEEVPRKPVTGKTDVRSRRSSDVEHAR